jgi:CRP-like cAMP-binding protein
MLADTQEVLEELFARRGWLSGQSADFRALVISHAQLQPYDRGETIYRDGDEPGGIFGVISGGIGIQTGPPFLAPRHVHVQRAGDWFGVGPMLRDGGRSLGMVATEPSRVLAVALASLRAISRQDSENLRRIGQIGSIGTDLAAGIISELLIPDSTRRVGAVLLRVTAALDGVEPDDPRGFLVGQSMLAEMANVSRSVVNAALGRFRAAGWVAQGYSRVRVLDARALAGFAFAED